MAYAAQLLEGLACLFYSIGFDIGKPALYCDNRAAVHLNSGSSEWRTKAIVHRIRGVTSLIELGVLDLAFKATADMEANALTKYMGAKVLTRQRQLWGLTPPPF